MKLKDATLQQIVTHCTLQRECSKCCIYNMCRFFQEAPDIWHKFENNQLESEVTLNE